MEVSSGRGYHQQRFSRILEKKSGEGALGALWRRQNRSLALELAEGPRWWSSG